MAEYTPTTDQVRELYANHRWTAGIPHAEFDRWLAEHDRETALNAYDSGYHDGYNQLPFYESLGWE